VPETERVSMNRPSRSSRAKASKAAGGEPLAEGLGNGRLVARFKRRQRASDYALAFGLIKHTYQHAIEYETVPVGVRGLIFFFGMVSSVIALGGGTMMFYDLIDVRNPGKFDYTLMTFVAMLMLCGVLIFLYTGRLEFFRPIDEPVIFDRKRRKIYRLYREVKPGLKGLFQRWPMVSAEHAWNTVTGEYRVTTTPTGRMTIVSHALHFVATARKDGLILVDDFQVANPMLLGESTVALFWEHIRRFMEEDGPHLPPGESAYMEPVPSSLWQSMGAVGPFGPNYFTWWRTDTAVTVIFHLIVWIVLPFSLVWAFFNWISYATAIDVQWPANIVDALGPAD
jgi:hypothetical protein